MKEGAGRAGVKEEADLEVRGVAGNALHAESEPISPTQWG